MDLCYLLTTWRKGLCSSTVDWAVPWLKQATAVTPSTGSVRSGRASPQAWGLERHGLSKGPASACGLARATPLIREGFPGGRTRTADRVASRASTCSVGQARPHMKARKTRQRSPDAGPGCSRVPRLWERSSGSWDSEEDGGGRRRAPPGLRCLRHPDTPTPRPGGCARADGGTGWRQDQLLEPGLAQQDAASQGGVKPVCGLRLGTRDVQAAILTAGPPRPPGPRMQREPRVLCPLCGAGLAGGCPSCPLPAMSGRWRMQATASTLNGGTRGVHNPPEPQGPQPGCPQGL